MIDFSAFSFPHPRAKFLYYFPYHFRIWIRKTHFHQHEDDRPTHALRVILNPEKNKSIDFEIYNILYIIW